MTSIAPTTTPRPTTPTPNAVAQILNEAAEVLDRNGWITGRLFLAEEMEGYECAARQAPCDAFAAILIAAGHDPDDEESTDPLVVRAAAAVVTWLEVQDELEPADPTAADAGECEHGEALATCAPCGIFIWNDNQTSQSQVTAALRSAATDLTRPEPVPSRQMTDDPTWHPRKRRAQRRGHRARQGGASA
ncbi:hypothetical protein [Actinomadura sp. 6N118]|uniref:DUF6197 family protein n=1 Tax=Actinomadura sp. 6N118 TaxID=3375151 RepID=UPI0037B56E4F